MKVDLDAWISLALAPGETDALDDFVSTCLHDGGVWDSPRTSDGIQDIERVLERSPECLRLCGRIWSIDQRLHTFWLEIQRAQEDGPVTWCLCFDVEASSPRRARNAVHDHDRPEDIDWAAVLAGEAAIRDDKLLPVPGATRSLGPDAPAHEPPDLS